MTSIALKSFAGETPRVRPDALPDNAAQSASNCEVHNGDLRPLRADGALHTFGAEDRSVYTEDGVTFFTWPYEVHAARSPVIDDTYHRTYFTAPIGPDGYGLRVTNATPSALGGLPSPAYGVGVPTPTYAPVLSTVERTTLRGYSGVYLGAHLAWYDAGAVHDVADITPTATAALRAYTFTPPTRPAGVSASAELRMTLAMHHSGGELFRVQLTAGAEPQRTEALPGGVELSFTAGGTITLSWGVYETRAYVYTRSNVWSEESAPSPAALIDVTYMQDVYVDVQMTGDPNYLAADTVRIYRTFGTSTSYVHAPADLLSVSPSNVYRYQDLTWRASDVGSALPSLDWQPPPTHLYGLTSLPGGVLAAFDGRQVYFSEPYHPHAWPYSVSFPHAVRGMRAAAQGMVVTTAAGCYLVLGAHPRSMQPQKLPVPQAGISHRSMAQVNGAVVFASHDGLVTVTGSQASLDASLQLFTRELWRETYEPWFDALELAYHDGMLLGRVPGAAVGFLVRLEEPANTFTRIYRYMTGGMYHLAATDTLYCMHNGTLYAFRDGYGTPDQLYWQSKDFRLPAPMNFGAVYLRADGPVTVTLYADGETWHEFTAAGTGYYRLPAGKRALQWSVALQTQSRVQEFVMAQSMGELRGV